MVDKILIVDDEDDVLNLMSLTLGDDSRYQLLQARHGEEALSIARQELPRVMFLDVMMPVKDGHEVCRALKQDPATADITVIMLTALAQESDREKAKEAGADGYLTKPFSPTELIEKVQSILGLP